MNTTLNVETPTDRDIVMTRTFDAPRDLVFEALTKPEHIRQWWGWSHWTMFRCEVDLRPGGAYYYNARSPEGQEVPMTGVFLEVEPPERIVFTEIYDVAPFNQGEPARVTAILHDLGGQTRLTLTSTLPSKEVRDAVLATGMADGAGHSYDRLAELLKKLR